MAGRVEILDRDLINSCGNLDCTWFCTCSAANRVQSVTGVSLQQGELDTLTSRLTTWQTSRQRAKYFLLWLHYLTNLLSRRSLAELESFDKIWYNIFTLSSTDTPETLNISVAHTSYKHFIAASFCHDPTAAETYGMFWYRTVTVRIFQVGRLYIWQRGQCMWSGGAHGK